MNKVFYTDTVCYTDSSDLISRTFLSSEEIDDIARVIRHYPMRIPEGYFSLIDPCDPDDPIARMCIPSLDELDPSGESDTSGERDNTAMTGLQHKYRQTALILTTNECAMYCRHCFRKRLVGISADELNSRVDVAVRYVKERPEINNVLLSGGDALMLPNPILRRYLSELCSIDSLDFIRIGTRLPAVLPQRITDDEDLLDMIAGFAEKKALCVVTQFDHPRELGEEQQKAVRCLTERSVQVRNQTVLLRGVNDSAETLGDLLRRLTCAGIIPYYVFQCRPVRGVKGRFQVPLAEGVRITDGARAMQNGIGKSFRYVMSHPRGKIEILGEDEDGRMIFKFHQNKNESDASRVFTVQLSADDIWLSDELKGTTC